MEYNIAAVERDTGLSKDVLRVWERRYGFPMPLRDVNGERLYPAAQVDRLRLIKRLIDQGHRPGKLLAATPEELARLPSRRPALVASAPPANDDLGELLSLLKEHDATGYREAMQQRLARHGLISFVQDIVAPLAVAVGVAWENGSFEVFEEHLFTEMTKRLLRQAIAALPVARGTPLVLLTTVPDEEHVLGLLMVEAVLTLEGAGCIALGTQVPLADTVRAAAAHRADIVALSFSVAFPQRQASSLLDQMRRMLPASVALWAGGSGVVRIAPADGIVLLPALGEALAALHAWRQEHQPTA